MQGDTRRPEKLANRTNGRALLSTIMEMGAISAHDEANFASFLACAL